MREAVLEGACESKRRGKGDLVSYSRNIFIPLTNLCRDRCDYCTFAKLPDSPDAKTYTLDEVAEVTRDVAFVRAASRRSSAWATSPRSPTGRIANGWRSAGCARTAEYLVQACEVAFGIGMLPHTNAGILRREEMERLRSVNASLGLMLESTSPRLRERGGAHFWAPDKEPAVRIRMHEEAGELGIPFTSGLLLGIGEDADERVDTLLVIRELADRLGHIQEVIVQPFHPKPGTRMRDVPALGDSEVAGWVAMARLLLGPAMNVQAPPNLAPEALELLLRSGLNDWGGVSPLTVDFINPEAPWPTLRELARRTEAAGSASSSGSPSIPSICSAGRSSSTPACAQPHLRLVDAAGWVPARRPHSQVEAA